MGVRGLYGTLSKALTSFSERVALHGSLVVVDGSAWTYFLVAGMGASAGVPGFAADYAALDACMRAWLDRFADAQVEVVFVFDGPREAAKMGTKLDRMQKQCHDADKVQNTGGRRGFLLPLHAEQCVVQTLNRRASSGGGGSGLRIFFSAGEADRDVARLAAEMGARAILSNDTDMLIYQYPNDVSSTSSSSSSGSGSGRSFVGMVTLDTLGFSPDGLELYGFRLSQRSVARGLRVEVSDLPYLAALLGNDHSDLGVLHAVHVALGAMPKAASVGAATIATPGANSSPGGARRGSKSKSKAKSSSKSKIKAKAKARAAKARHGTSGAEALTIESIEVEMDGEDVEHSSDEVGTEVQQVVWRWHSAMASAGSGTSSATTLLPPKEAVMYATEVMRRARAMAAARCFAEGGDLSLELVLEECISVVLAAAVSEGVMLGILREAVVTYTVTVEEEREGEGLLGNVHGVYHGMRLGCELLQACKDGVYLSAVVSEPAAVLRSDGTVVSHCSFTALTDVRRRVFSLVHAACDEGGPESASDCVHEVLRYCIVGEQDDDRIPPSRMHVQPTAACASSVPVVSNALDALVWAISGSEPGFGLTAEAFALKQQLVGGDRVPDNDHNMLVCASFLWTNTVSSLVNINAAIANVDTNSVYLDTGHVEHYRRALVQSIILLHSPRSAASNSEEILTEMHMHARVWTQLQVCLLHARLAMEAATALATTLGLEPFLSHELDLAKLSFPAFCAALEGQL
jgi:hypothetical protein